MWRMYNIVQLQPLLCRNQGTNSSSRSHPPSIIDHSKKENGLAMKGNSNENLTQKLSSLRKPVIDMNNRMPRKHASWYGGSKKVINRFRDVLRNRFYDCDKSNAGSRLFKVAEEMKDKTGTEDSLIRQVKMSSFTNTLLKPEGKLEQGSKQSQRCENDLINTVDISASECSSSAKRHFIEDNSLLCKDKLQKFQVVDKNSTEMWSGQPPSQKLEEILTSLRKWEKKVGWSSANPLISSSRQMELNKIRRYAIKMQNKNNIRNLKSNLGVDHSNIHERLKNCSNKTTAINENPGPVNRLSEKNKHHGEIELTEVLNKRNNIRAGPDKIQEIGHLQQSNINFEVKEIDCIIRHCENLKRSYLMRNSLQNIQEKYNRKPSREIQHSESKLQGKGINAHNDPINTTTKEIVVSKGPQFQISVRKINNLNKCRESSHKIVQNEIRKRSLERNQHPKLSKINDDDFDSFGKNSRLMQSSIENNRKNSERKSMLEYRSIEKELSKKCWETMPKSRNQGVQMSIKEKEFLKKCQEAVCKKHFLRAERKDVMFSRPGHRVSDLENKFKKKCLEAKQKKKCVTDINKNMRQHTDNDIHRPDDGLTKYVTTDWPSSVLCKIFEFDAIKNLLRNCFATSRLNSNFDLSNRGTHIQKSDKRPGKTDSNAQLNLDSYSKIKSWLYQWMQKLVHGSNVALPLPHFKGGYLIGNSQSSMKLLDLKEDQLHGYDETDC